MIIETLLILKSQFARIVTYQDYIFHLIPPFMSIITFMQNVYVITRLRDRQKVQLNDRYDTLQHLLYRNNVLAECWNLNCSLRPSIHHLRGSFLAVCQSFNSVFIGRITIYRDHSQGSVGHSIHCLQVESRFYRDYSQGSVSHSIQYIQFESPFYRDHSQR